MIHYDLPLMVPCRGGGEDKPCTTWVSRRFTGKDQCSYHAYAWVAARKKERWAKKEDE